MKHITLLACLLLVLSAAVGCGDDPAPSSSASTKTAEASPSSDAGPTTVRLDVVAKRDGAGLRVSGTANVIDGAKIVCEVSQTHGLWLTGDRYMTVKNGKFSDRLKKAPSGELEVWVAFDVAKGVSKQPRAVYDAYGAYGEQITNGEEQYGGGRRVEATTTVQ